MKLLGIRNVKELADIIGMSPKTVGAFVNDPDRKVDPNLEIWAARVLMVRENDLKRLRAGEGVQIRDEDREPWDHYERAGPQKLEATIPTALRKRFMAIAALTAPGQAAQCAFEVLVNSYELMSRHHLIHNEEGSGEIRIS